jgi:hypothetical protein
VKREDRVDGGHSVNLAIATLEVAGTPNLEEALRKVMTALYHGRDEGQGTLPTGDVASLGESIKDVEAQLIDKDGLPVKIWQGDPDSDE